MRLDLSSVGCQNPISEGLGSSVHFIVPLVLSLDDLVLLVLPLFSLLSVLFIQAKLGLLLVKAFLGCHLDLVLKTLSQFALVVIWRLFSKWTGSTLVLGIFKRVRGHWSFVFIANVGAHVLLSILLLVSFDALFSLTVLGIVALPRSARYSCRSLPEIVSFPVHLLSISIL